MSISTDLASLDALALLHRSPSMESCYLPLIEILKRVAHFEWIGIYMQQEDQMKLMSASDTYIPFSLAQKTLLYIPIQQKQEEMIYGKLVIISYSLASFDETDYTTMQKIGEEIARKLGKK